MSSFVQVVISQNELKLLGSVENESPWGRKQKDFNKKQFQKYSIADET